MNEACQTAIARAPALAPVVLRHVPSWVTRAFPLLSPLAAVYWRERWNTRPERIGLDLEALARSFGLMPGDLGQLDEPEAVNGLSLEMTRAIATALESQLSPDRPFLPLAYLVAAERLARS